MRRSALKISWACALLASGTAACSPDYPAQSPSTSGTRPAHGDETPHAWTPPPANDYTYSPPNAEPAPGPENPSGRALAVFQGQASYYGDSLAGNKTASGERYNPRAFTAAHKTLAFGTVVRVVRPDTGASVTVRITDRGPFVARRVLDLSRAAAERLRMIRSGVVEVRAEVVTYGPPPKKKRRK
jgi:rare lipoprotein A